MRIIPPSLDYWSARRTGFEDGHYTASVAGGEQLAQVLQWPAQSGTGLMKVHHLAPPEVSSLASSTLAVFESLLAQSLGHQRTSGACLYAAVLCKTLINRFTSYQAIVRGGDGEADGGLFIGKVGHGHYWIEASKAGQAFVVDITGDQFGLPPIVVAPLQDLPARYIPGDQATVDAHARELQCEIEAEMRG
ncbi:Hypothetical protein (plasmid) [Pseudomonas putida]|jgi:hypothetical protein|nr:hypothetical protein [Pseudomonas sp.]QIZ23016.1 Hypothetical protein [Pseudomonas putida]